MGWLPDGERYFGDGAYVIIRVADRIFRKLSSKDNEWIGNGKTCTTGAMAEGGTGIRFMIFLVLL